MAAGASAGLGATAFLGGTFLEGLDGALLLAVFFPAAGLVFFLAAGFFFAGVDFLAAGFFLFPAFFFRAGFLFFAPAITASLRD